MPGRLVESFDWERLDFELESLPKMPANSRGVFAAKESDTSPKVQTLVQDIDGSENNREKGLHVKTVCPCHFPQPKSWPSLTPALFHINDLS